MGTFCTFVGTNPKELEAAKTDEEKLKILTILVLHSPQA